MVSDLSVHAGSSDQIDSLAGQTIGVSNTTIPSSFQLWNLKNDIAIITLSSPLVYNQRVQPIKYSTPCNTPIDSLQNGRLAILTGWGHPSANQTFPSQFLKQTTMPIIDSATANQLNSSSPLHTQYDFRADSNNLCFYQPGTAAAPGDSGGPVTMTVNGEPILIGVSSWGYDPKDQYPSIYTKVRNYEDFIRTATNKLNPLGQLDLYTKDNFYDVGEIGINGTGGRGDRSPDIWVRNQPDGLTNYAHENPEYQVNDSCYVYVRVRNRSCNTSSGTEKLTVYWTKASSWSSWPQNWNGTQPTIGDTIQTQLIPPLRPYEDTIMEFAWHPLDSAITHTWHYCLLSRIEDIVDDPITPYPQRIDKEITENNNLSLRNVTVVNLLAGRPGGRVLVGNPLTQPQSYNIHLRAFSPHDTAIADVTAEAEVRMAFDSLGWAIMQASGQLSQPGIVNAGENEILITNPNVTFSNIGFPPEVRIPIDISFHFLTQQASDKADYNYSVCQSFASDSSTILGCETYEIHKNPRQPFYANAGIDQVVNKGSQVTLSAASIAEVVNYEWYDQGGELVYSGQDYTFTPEISQDYTLAVTAVADGFLDYDHVYVQVNPNYLTAAYPNPATSQITLGYQLSAANTGNSYLMVLQPYGSTMYNYLLPANSSSYTINTTGYALGTYNAVLIANGTAVDVVSFTVH